MTIFRQFLWMLRRGFTILSGILPPGPASAQIGDPYVKAGLTIVLYNSFALWNVAPHVDCVSLLIIWTYVSALSCILFVIDALFTLLDNCHPRSVACRAKGMELD